MSADFVVITRRDSLYPERLRELHSAPEKLYLLGNAELLRAAIPLAVVGARKMTPYGRDTATQFSGQLAAAGVTIVSGMALGIDAVAHTAALDAGGATIAVLGCGIDLIYPKSHAALHRRLAAHGLIISEFPPGTPAYASNFPQRNRIISGMSLGVLVVQAALDSGSLITARCALEQGRSVFTVPFPLYDNAGAGNNRLLRQGAITVTQPLDIIEDIAPQAGLSLPSGQKTTKDTRFAPHTTLSPIEVKLMRQLEDQPSGDVETLVQVSGLKVGTVLETLSGLELQGRIRREWDGRFTVCRNR